MNSTVYDFLGYRVRQVSYSVHDNYYPVSIKISIPQSMFDQKTHDFQFLIFVEGKDANGDSNLFLAFQSFFIINDQKWYDSLKKNNVSLESILFPVVFPFIRQKLMTALEDTNYSPVIPIVDLRGIDLKKGIEISL